MVQARPFRGLSRKGGPLEVLIPLDGSRRSEGILRTVVRLAAAAPVRATLLRVADRTASLRAAEESLRESASYLADRGVWADTAAVVGEPVREILSACRAGGFDWIAMSTHGRSGLGRAVVGSVTEEVLRRSRVPILTARAGAEEARWDHLLVPLDGSSASEEVLPDVARLARRVAAPVHLLHAAAALLPRRSLEAVPFSALPGRFRAHLGPLRDRLRREGVAALPTVRKGPPAREIVREARRLGDCVVCMTTHGRTGLARLLSGSVAESVLRAAPCPVLVRRSL